MVAAGTERITSWSSGKARGSKIWHQSLAAIAAIALFWPLAAVDAGVGLDSSKQTAVALARILNLRWGAQIVFTCGPLAFLQSSAFYSYWQSVVATTYQMAVIAALFLGVAAALRQRQTPAAALVRAFVTTGVIGILLGPTYTEWMFFAAFAWASVPLLQQEPARSTMMTTCSALAAVAGFELLIKITAGLAIAAIALATSALLDWRAVGRHCITIAAFAASLPLWWMLAGQRLSDLPTWLGYSVDLASGYLGGMAGAIHPSPFLVANLVYLAGAAALCAMFVYGSTAVPRRYVALAGLVIQLATLAAFEHFDPWHFCVLLAAISVALVIAPRPPARGRADLVVGVTIALILAEVAGAGTPTRAAGVVQTPERVAERLLTLAMPGRHKQRVEQAKSHQRALFAVPDRFITVIGSAAVHVDPQDISAVWAYNLNWHPTPVFQTYAAYTPTLDKLNAASVAEGTEFVLSRISSASPATGIDGRLGVQESPLYSRKLLCDYDVSGIENRWALFRHTNPHCGPLTPVGQVRIGQHDTIAIPDPSGPDMAVLVALDLDQSIKDRLLGAVAPLTNFTIMLDGVTYRLVAKNAREPFLVTTPASYAGTNLQINAHRIALNPSAPLPIAGLRFYEMRVNS